LGTKQWIMYVDILKKVPSVVYVMITEDVCLTHLDGCFSTVRVIYFSTAYSSGETFTSCKIFNRHWSSFPISSTLNGRIQSHSLL